MINLPEDEEIKEIVDAIDDLLEKYVPTIGPTNLCSILLSRAVLLTQHEPALGKDLLRYVWERLDQIEQDRPGGDFDF